jgi:cytochrome oxidase Cu insertion factor (SCO1/SenC/PrrC family)
MQAAHRIAAAGRARRVVFVETTVDPRRDTPARLRAFQRLIDDRDVVMLTGTAAHIRAFWRFFGVWDKRVPEGTPPGVDWWTHGPEHYDVNHTDAVLIIDPEGRWHLAVLGMADSNGHLATILRRLLDATGLKNLRRPTEPWTVSELLQDIGHVLGQTLLPSR